MALGEVQTVEHHFVLGNKDAGNDAALAALLARYDDHFVSFFQFHINFLECG